MKHTVRVDGDASFLRFASNRRESEQNDPLEEEQSFHHREVTRLRQP